MHARTYSLGPNPARYRYRPAGPGAHYVPVVDRGLAPVREEGGPGRPVRIWSNPSHAYAYAYTSRPHGVCPASTYRDLPGACCRLRGRLTLQSSGRPGCKRPAHARRWALWLAIRAPARRRCIDPFHMHAVRTYASCTYAACMLIITVRSSNEPAGARTLSMDPSTDRFDAYGSTTSRKAFRLRTIDGSIHAFIT